jgi:hypothetical protein
MHIMSSNDFTADLVRLPRSSVGGAVSSVGAARSDPAKYENCQPYGH